MGNNQREATLKLENLCGVFSKISAYSFSKNKREGLKAPAHSLGDPLNVPVTPKHHGNWPSPSLLPRGSPEATKNLLGLKHLEAFQLHFAWSLCDKWPCCPLFPSNFLLPQHEDHTLSIVQPTTMGYKALLNNAINQKVRTPCYL